jgi:hypothetical protein
MLSMVFHCPKANVDSLLNIYVALNAYHAVLPNKNFKIFAKMQTF